MTARECVARAWHAGSDHAAESPFGGPLCNCDQVAGRMLPMLHDAYVDGILAGRRSIRSGVAALDACQASPYETEEDRHVDP